MPCHESGSWSSSEVATVLSLFLLLASCSPKMQTIALGIGNETFHVQVAKSPADQANGLMRRKHLPEDSGMLFVYDQDRRLTFWMKNTEIPLSIAFVSVEGRIMQIEDMEPFSLEPIRSQRSVRYALEVNRGAFDRAGARVGDTITFPESFR